jgi:hypothetical protein
MIGRVVHLHIDLASRSFGDPRFAVAPGTIHLNRHHPLEESVVVHVLVVTFSELGWPEVEKLSVSVVSVDIKKESIAAAEHITNSKFSHLQITECYNSFVSYHGDKRTV